MTMFELFVNNTVGCAPMRRFYYENEAIAAAEAVIRTINDDPSLAPPDNMRSSILIRRIDGGRGRMRPTPIHLWTLDGVVWKYHEYRGRPLPPHRLEVEQLVLGAVIRDNRALDRVLDIVQPWEFYHATHKTIFRGIIDLKARNKPINVSVLSKALGGELEHIGSSVAYLVGLNNHVPDGFDVRAAARTVRRMADRRRRRAA